MPERQERQAICPYCHEDIDHLNYNSNVNDWGTCDIDGDNFECRDAETQETDYRCSQCGHLVDPYGNDNFYPEPEPEEENENKPQPPPEEESNLIDKHNECYGLRFFICPKCQEKLAINDKNNFLNEEIECPQCKTITNANNAKILNV